MTTPSGSGFLEFASRVGAEFALHVEGGVRVPAVLTDCSPTGPGAFSLVFKVGSAAPVEQGIFDMSADGLGPEAIFLVPVARRPDDPAYPLEYQAIFNSPPVATATTSAPPSPEGSR